MLAKIPNGIEIIKVNQTKETVTEQTGYKATRKVIGEIVRRKELCLITGLSATTFCHVF